MQFGLQKSRALFIEILGKTGSNTFWLCFHRIDKIYWFCMSSFAANFQGLELHSSPARLQTLLNLEKLSYYLRMQKQKLKEFRVCTNISCSNIMEKEQYCENSKEQCAHVQTSFYLCLQCSLPRSGHNRFDKHLIPKI